MKTATLALALAVVALPALAADFTATITDPAALAGIADARGKANVALGCAADGTACPVSAAGAPAVQPYASDGAYVAWVMQQAAASWGQAKMQSDISAATSACLKGDCTAAQALITAQTGK